MLPHSGFEPDIFVINLSGQNIAHTQEYLQVYYLDQELNLAPLIYWANIIHKFILEEDFSLKH